MLPMGDVCVVPKLEVSADGVDIGGKSDGLRDCLNPNQQRHVATVLEYGFIEHDAQNGFAVTFRTRHRLRQASG